MASTSEPAVPLPCKLFNDTNDAVAMILTQNGSKSQTLVNLLPGTSIALPGSCARPPGVVGVVPASSFVITSAVLSQLAVTPVLPITKTLQLVRNGAALVVTEKGASVPPPTQGCTFSNTSSEYVLVGGVVNSVASISGVLLGTGGSFSMMPCPTQMAAVPETAIVVTGGPSYFIASTKDMTAIVPNAPLALCAVRENGLLYTYVMTRPDANTFTIRKLGQGQDQGQEQTGGLPSLSPATTTTLARIGNFTPSNSGCTTVMPLVQDGTPIFVTITLIAFLAIFFALFIVFVTLYTKKSNPDVTAKM